VYSNIIWLGDLNYRLAAGYEDTHELLKKNNWQALLEKDQVCYDFWCFSLLLKISLLTLYILLAAKDRAEGWSSIQRLE